MDSKKFELKCRFCDFHPLEEDDISANWQVANLVDKLGDGRFVLCGEYGSLIDGSFYIVSDHKLLEFCDKERLGLGYCIQLCNKCTSDTFVPGSTFFGYNPCMFFDTRANLHELLEKEKESKITRPVLVSP